MVAMRRLRRWTLATAATAAGGLALSLAGATTLAGGCATGSAQATEAIAVPPAEAAQAPEPPATLVSEPPAAPEASPPPAGDGGWGYLVERLVADGLDRQRVLRTVQDPRFDAFDGLSFRLEPRESRALYRSFLRPGSIARARECRAEHASAFEHAERTQSVPASVVAAILHVETGCGRNTGSSPILHRLARLAMAGEPRNLELNFERNATVNGVRDPALEKRTRDRARYLEALFYPEVRATFEIADRLKIDPLDLLGSDAGAFGNPQFLPTSYLRHGVDGNGDGRVDLYDVSDAAASAARYLAVYGWKPGLSRAEKRRVIFHYNRSDAYVDTVLGVATLLEKPARAARTKAGSKQKVATGG